MLPPLTKQIDTSIQALPDAEKNPYASGFWESIPMRGPLLAPFGTRMRERQLRDIYRNDYNGIVRGAFAGIAKTIASTPFEIKGPETLTKDTAKYYRATAKAAGMVISESSQRPDIEYYQELLRQADFGRGWTSLIEKVIKDFLRQDGGAFIEVIGAGKASKAPRGAVMGLAALDSLRVLPTGDPEYPALYWNMHGEYHLIHNTRLIQLQDMPDTDEIRPGYGECALSRAVAIANREISMGRYIDAQLDDLPSPGFMAASGMLESQRAKAVQLYRADQSNDSRPEWGKLIWFFSQDPTMPITLEQIPFQQPPEKFSFQEYTTIDIDSLALALGVDRQELWQLSGGNIGSGSQSETLAQKARGKTLGIIRAELTRQINDLMPDEYVFEFKYEDAAEEKEKAATAQMWVSAVTSLTNILSTDEQRRLLADTVKAIQDVVTDENGEMVTATDADVQPPAQVIAADITANARLNANNGGQNGGAVKPSGADSAVRKPSNAGAKARGWNNADFDQQTIESEFEQQFVKAVNDYLGNRITKIRASIILRELLREYGLREFRSAMKTAGIEIFNERGDLMALNVQETSAYTRWLIDQGVFVSRFINELDKRKQQNEQTDRWWLLLPIATTLKPVATALGETLNPFSASGRAKLWIRKSLGAIRSQAIMIADKNGMYEFVGTDGFESCETCMRLKGQVHRYSDWYVNHLRPQVDTDNYDCGGWNCQHKLRKTTKAEQGNF